MSYDLGVLLLRLVIGALLFGHGTQKLFGWFGGPGFAGARAMFGGHLRLRPATFWTAMAGLTEAGGGLLLALGLLNPLGSLAVIAAMVMAALLAHWPRVWLTENGMEYTLVLMAAATAIALGGPGRYSLDAILGIALPAPATFLVGLALVLFGVVAALAMRAPAAAEASQPTGA